VQGTDGTYNHDDASCMMHMVELSWQFYWNMP